MNSVFIKTFPRIHITLIGLNKQGYRMNGGIGFSITNPCLNISISVSDRFVVKDKRKLKLNETEYERLLKSLNMFFEGHKLEKKITIIIEGDLIPHHGFGSETSLRLACLEGLCIVNKLNISTQEIVTNSGRGGTSGIGINTYFSGGFVFDIGRKNNETSFLPSNFSEQRIELPLAVTHIPTPSWEIGLFLSSEINSLNGIQEKRFFEDSCPIPEGKAYEILYHSIYGCLSSIISNDKETFCLSIQNVQKTLWKSLERKLYGDKIDKIENKLYQIGALAVGMSSLGPLIYFLANDKVDSLILRAKELGLNGKFAKATMNNIGRVIKNV